MLSRVKFGLMPDSVYDTRLKVSAMINLPYLYSLVAGTIESWTKELNKLGDYVLTHKISHLKDLMYASSTHEFKNVLEYNAAVLSEIERGNRNWGTTIRT